MHRQEENRRERASLAGGNYNAPPFSSPGILCVWMGRKWRVLVGVETMCMCMVGQWFAGSAVSFGKANTGAG